MSISSCPKIYIPLSLGILFRGGIFLAVIDPRRKAIRQILEYLSTKVLEDEITKYELSKSLNLSRGAIYDLLPLLEDEGFVKTKIIGTAPTGHPKKAYALAPQGLIEYLGVELLDLFPKNPEGVLKLLDKIAEKNKETLPYIFGKWDHFKKFDGAIRLLGFLLAIKVIELFHTFREYYEYFKNQPKGLSEAVVKKFINEWVFDPVHLATSGWPSKVREDWLKTLTSDPDLKRYIRTRIENRLELFHVALISQKKIKAAIMDDDPSLLPVSEELVNGDKISSTYEFRSLGIAPSSLIELWLNKFANS